jgi:hypothetical protein
MLFYWERNEIICPSRGTIACAPCLPGGSPRRNGPTPVSAQALVSRAVHHLPERATQIWHGATSRTNRSGSISMPQTRQKPKRRLAAQPRLGPANCWAIILSSIARRRRIYGLVGSVLLPQNAQDTFKRCGGSHRTFHSASPSRL